MSAPSGIARPTRPQKKRRAPRHAVLLNFVVTGLVSESRDVDGLRSLAHAIRLGVEGNLLAFAQRLDAGSLESRDVNEHILRAAFWRDETKTLVLVEEFNGALGRHGNSPFPS